MAAVGALIEMAAQRGGAATLNRRQHFEMLPAEPAATRLDETLSGGADQIGHFQSGMLHELLSAPPPYPTRPPLLTCSQRGNSRGAKGAEESPTTYTSPVSGSKNAVGECAEPPAMSVLFSAAKTSRYPAPTVKMSYWVVNVSPVTGLVAMLKLGNVFDALFIRRALTWSGVRLGSLSSSSATAPLTIGVAMLVPLSLK